MAFQSAEPFQKDTVSNPGTGNIPASTLTYPLIYLTKLFPAVLAEFTGIPGAAGAGPAIGRIARRFLGTALRAELSGRYSAAGTLPAISNHRFRLG